MDVRDMTLAIAGTFRAPPERLDALKAAMAEMLDASRAEPGCIEYCYALDVETPGLVRVFELWRGRAELEAHSRSAHLARWREACSLHGVTDRSLTAYEIASSELI